MPTFLFGFVLIVAVLYVAWRIGYSIWKDRHASVEEVIKEAEDILQAAGLTPEQKVQFAKVILARRWLSKVLPSNTNRLPR